ENRGPSSWARPISLALRGSEGLTDKHESVALLAEEAEAPLLEIEELRTLVSTGRERGFLTFEEIAGCLEEVEITKEQVRDLHRHLLDGGIEIVAADGRPAPTPAEPPAPPPEGAPAAPKKPEIDLTVEP